MEKITITREAQASIDDIKAAGKTPWIVLHNGVALVARPGREQAREAKKANNFNGAVMKADDVELVREEATLAEAAQALHDSVVAEVKAPEVAAPVAEEKATKKVGTTSESTAERPCKLVWVIAEDMLAANPNVKRKEVLAECERRGVTYFTARTQYQQWLTVRKEMAAREAGK